MATSIYLDDETKEIIRQIKKENNDFNFSAYIKRTLMEWRGGQTVAQVDKILNDLDLELLRLKQSREYWKIKRDDAVQREAVEKLKHEEREAEAHALKLRQEKRKIDIIKTFKELTGRDMTDLEFDEFMIQFEAGKTNIFTFSEHKKEVKQ